MASGGHGEGSRADGLQVAFTARLVSVCTRGRRGRRKKALSYASVTKIDCIIKRQGTFVKSSEALKFVMTTGLKKEVLLLSNPRAGEKTIQRQVVGS